MVKQIKKLNMKKITLTIIAILSFYGIFAQIGSTCSTPFVINSLPFNTSANTDSTLNTYDGVCGSSYASGNDFIFEYTPANDVYVNITLSGTDNLTGLFVTEGCPDVGTCVTNNEGIAGNPFVNLVNLTSGTTYYIMVSSNSLSGFGTETTPFTIDIDTVPSVDMAVTEVSGLESGCSLTQDTLVVTVTNLGAATVNSYDISYTVNGGSPLTETITATLANGESKTDTLTTYIDLSTIDHYDVDVAVVLAGDADNTNDNIIAHAVCSPQLSTFPYTQEYDGATDMWWFTEGTSSTWEMGTPAATIINSASSGTNSWATNLTGNSNRNETSYLVSPCYDFSLLLNPKISFDLWAEMAGGIASIGMEYSTDNGNTWTAMPEGITVNWDKLGMGTSTGGWVTVSDVVATFSGEQNIKFRFAYSGALVSDAEGVAIDNFSIESCISTNPPIAGFTYTQNGTVVEFTNTSTNATSYSWSFGDVLNSTSTEINPSQDYLIDGTYIVTLTAFSDCEFTTYTDTVVINTTGINSINNTSFNVYPNPAIDMVTINTNENGNVMIININGDVLLNTNIENNKTIDISKFEKGVYIIKFTSSTNIINQKLLIR